MKRPSRFRTKILPAFAFVVFLVPAWAQEEVLKVGQALVEQTVELHVCLKKEMDKVSSTEDAQTLAQSACADVAFIVRPKLIETV
jgi:hypothetical protein